jgi:hypothetical protein
MIFASQNETSTLVDASFIHLVKFLFNFDQEHTPISTFTNHTVDKYRLAIYVPASSFIIFSDRLFKSIKNKLSY